MAKIPRILIVEDDEIIASLIALMLEKKGYCIAGSSASGEESIRKAAELEPDLILMDINLNGKMDGVTAAQYIFQLFHVPIIFLTAMCDDTFLERAMHAQPYGYLFKPFSDRELTSTIKRALAKRSIQKKHPDQYPFSSPQNIMEDPDAIIITDPMGRIIFFNSRAGRFLDLPDNRILMSHWRDVMMLIDDQTDEQIGDPLAEAVREMRVVTYDFPAAVVTLSGIRRNVCVTTRPVRDGKNNLLGVFLHIREKDS